MYKSLTISEVLETEAKIGRKLTPREIISGEVERIDKRTTGERIDAQLWEPVMQKPAATTPYDDYVAEAERAADEEQFAKLTPAQRRLAEAKNMQAKALQAQTDAAAMKDHIAKHQPQLDKLRALKDSIRLDPSWSAADSEAISRAISQIEAGPLADAAETQRLYEQPFRLLAEKKQALRNDAAARRADLETQLSTLDAELAAINGTTVSTSDSFKSIREEMDADFDRMSARLDELAANRERIAKRFLGDSQGAAASQQQATGDAGATDAT